MPRSLAHCWMVFLACAAMALGDPVDFSSATATFEQSSQYGVATAVDGDANSATGWSVYNGQFSGQTAIFTAAAPVRAASLEFQLYQNFGSKHWINEFRLSVTADPLPSLNGNWTEVSPLAMQSSDTTLFMIAGHIRSVGSSATTTYKIQTAAPLPSITGFRLEVFPFDFKSGDALVASLGEASDGNFILSEFVVIPDPPSTGNIALNCPVVASAATSPTSANLTDGRLRSYTHPASNVDATGFYYEVDLGKVWEIDHLILRNRADCCASRLTNYEVQTFDADPGEGGEPGSLTWHALVHPDGSDSGEGGADTLSAANGTGTLRGRYVRVINRSGAANNPEIAELEVYGSLLPAIASFKVTGSDNIASGQSTTLSWVTGNVTSVTISPGVGAVATSGTITVSPAATTTYTLMATGPIGTTYATVRIGVDVPLDPLRITELVADQNLLKDEDGDTPDWIELSNPNPFSLKVGGYRLINGDIQWTLPALTMAPAARLVVFASGKDRSDPAHPLHANFALNRDGETLALRDPLGALLQTFTFPALPLNVGYGTPDGGGSAGFFKPATPGAPNGALTYSGLAGGTTASVSRGYYTAPIDVVLLSETPGAQIRYTLDGSLPTATTGTPYATPIHVTTTTTLRAASFVPAWAPGDVVTHTYLFPLAVLAQPAAPPGFPGVWTDAGTTVPADYQMDPTVTQSPAYSGQMVAGLTSIRTLSVVMDPADLFGANGIYMNPQLRGSLWERATSIELLLPPDATHPNGSTGFQENCGIRIFGYGWRPHLNSLKHSFRLKFKDTFNGPPKLDYPLFANWPVTSFDNLVLRAGGSRSWNDYRSQDIKQTQYLHDAFARDTAAAMGKPDAPATFVHLYLNGLYWGLYNIVPRPDASFGEENLGGNDEDYDALNSRLGALEVVDGTEDAWDQVVTLMQSGLGNSANYAQFQQLVDVDNLIDFVIYNLWATNHDGPVNQNNFRALRRRSADGRWRFYFWDMEYTLWEPTEVMFTNVATVGKTVWPVFSELRNNAEFRLRFADRLHRHCFNQGALTPAAAINRWNTRADEIYTAILGESARWGDVRRKPPYTRDVEWAAERTRLTGTYFPQRTAVFLANAQAAGLYPSLAAPELAQNGGAVPPGYTATLSAPAGAIYYSLDGTDPRASDGSVAGKVYLAPVALPEGKISVRARALQGATWSALTEAQFFVGLGPLSSAKIVFSEINYHPAPGGTEFIELMNVGSLPVDLAGCRFTRGIDYTFPAPTILAPGERLVLTKAQYGGKLSSSGETVTLTQPDGFTVLYEVTYGTEGPWPESANGGGPSLTLINPMGNPPPNDPASWRASLVHGGTPGGTDALSFTGSVTTDSDGDGLCALVEYALGTSDSIPNADPAYTYLVDGRLYITFPLRPGADDIYCTVETSTDLLVWNGGPAFVEPVTVGPDFATWRVVHSAPKQYLRVRVNKRPGSP